MPGCLMLRKKIYNILSNNSLMIMSKSQSLFVVEMLTKLFVDKIT